MVFFFFFSEDHFKKSSWQSHAHTSYRIVNYKVNKQSSNTIIKGQVDPAHTMKLHMGTRGVAPFTLNPSASWHHASAVLALGKNSGTDWIGGWVGPRAQSEQFGEEKSLLPLLGLKPQTDWPVA